MLKYTLNAKNSLHTTQMFSFKYVHIYTSRMIYIIIRLKIRLDIFKVCQYPRKVYSGYLISEIPFVSEIYSLVIDVLATILTLTTLALIFRYYGSLMETQKTVITTLMRVLMVSVGILVAWFIIMTYIQRMMPDQVSSF